MNTVIASDTRTWGAENIFFALLSIQIAGSHGLTDDERRGFDLAIAASAAVFGIEYQEIKNAGTWNTDATRQPR